MNTEDDVNEKDLIMTLLQQNNQLQNHIIELCKEKSITNIINTNSHNKTFNLNVFLNETCKDAMNITDFVNSIKLQLSDLENVGEIGYVEGLSNIIVKNLNALDVTLRPVHCTDKKRETMYIKDEDKWEKEDEKKAKLHKMIRKIANKNINLISDFKALYPDWKKSTSKVSDQFNKIIIESMGGPGDNEYENEEKIIKKIAKEVYIDKNPPLEKVLQS
jgi:vacuolar-type H+-ATPase subunit F/Vma7